ncbi:host-nuclease inhibitor Gam family protein [Bacillus toyonensis]|uniref:host-nuclease inhibitor Gam family protein n=1 Tax=Bacillus toyonensis TaxID=155322 RepID=UPI00027BEAA5|nr:host-nuclease inhibitor Gam family protein [Bacillus toyonensis]EJV41773.1 hypothetical protein IEA_05658 [Bacillus toyonensis]
MNNEYMHDELVDIERLQEEDSGFKIVDIDGLNFAFRKINALKHQEAEVMALANKERERINKWVEKQLLPINNSISFFESHAKTYHQREFANDPKKKKISTPYGSVKTRTSKEAPEAADKDLLLEYAIENDLDEAIKSEIRWAEIKKHLKVVEVAGEKVVIDVSSGQIVPGVIVKPESIAFSIEVEE